MNASFTPMIYVYICITIIFNIQKPKALYLSMINAVHQFSLLLRTRLVSTYLEGKTNSLLPIRGTYYHDKFMYSMYGRGQNCECALSRSAYYPGVCANQECVLSRSVYYLGVCTNQECVLTRNLTHIYSIASLHYSCFII